MILSKKNLPVIVLIGGLLILGSPLAVHAATFNFRNGLNNAYTWGVGTAATEGGLSALSVTAIISLVIWYFVSLIGFLSILGIVIGGTLYVVSAGNEARTSQAKRIIASSLIGLFIVLARGIFIAVVYGWLGIVPPVALGLPATTFINITINVINFLQALIAIVSTLMIIIGGFMYLTSVGDEQKTTKAKQTIFAALAGLFVALIAGVLVDAIRGISGAIALDPVPLLSKVFRIISYILSFTAVIAVGAFIFGGFTYLTSGGNDEKLQRGKKILIYTAIGLVVIMLSAAVSNIIISL